MISQNIKISAIRIDRERRRVVQSPAVKLLAESIETIGLQMPISVRMENGVPVLIAGAYRIAAAQSLGWDEIDAVVFENELDARIWEIDENLRRTELTAIERSEQIAERAKLLGGVMEGVPEVKDNRLKTRAEAVAAGAMFYYPAKPCRKGHDDGYYTSIGRCVTCSTAAKAEWQRKRADEGYQVAQVGPPSIRHGQGQKRGDRDAARKMGVSRQTVGRAKAINLLPERAKQEAINLGLANNHHALIYAAAHEGTDLQIKALRSFAEKKAEKAKRKQAQADNIAAQAKAAASIAPRELPMHDQRREAAIQYWLWLIEECGEKAYPILSRLKELDIHILFEEVDRMRREGGPPPGSTKIH